MQTRIGLDILKYANLNWSLLFGFLLLRVDECVQILVTPRNDLYCEEYIIQAYRRKFHTLISCR